MREYIEKASEVFKEIIDKYHLKFFELDDRIFALKGKDFALDLTMEIEGVSIAYLVKNDVNEEVQYNIDWYIASKIDDIDRKESSKHSRDSIMDTAISDLYILSSTLKRHFSNILSGDKEWLEDFKKSKYFIEPYILDSHN